MYKNAIRTLAVTAAAAPILVATSVGTASANAFDVKGGLGSVSINMQSSSEEIQTCRADIFHVPSDGLPVAANGNGRYHFSVGPHINHTFKFDGFQKGTYEVNIECWRYGTGVEVRWGPNIVEVGPFAPYS